MIHIKNICSYVKHDSNDFAPAVTYESEARDIPLALCFRRELELKYVFKKVLTAGNVGHDV